MSRVICPVCGRFECLIQINLEKLYPPIRVRLTPGSLILPWSFEWRMPESYNK